MIRILVQLHRNTSHEIFQNTVKRALQYRITEGETIERIASQLMKLESYEFPWVEEMDDEELKNRDSYLEGQFTDEPDLAEYDHLLDQQSDDNEES